MQRKSTLSHLVNKLEKVNGACEDWENEMEESDFEMELRNIGCTGPSERTIKAILDFTQSYHYENTQTLNGIDLYLN